MKKDSRKKNDKGFSLLEVLIAMAILGVIVVPLLHSFVSAALTNAKAKKVLRATTVVQNTMEEIKASSVKNFAICMDGYTSDENGDALKKTFVTSSYTFIKDSQTFTAFEAAAPGTGDTTYVQTGTPSVTAVKETEKNASGEVISTKYLTTFNELDASGNGKTFTYVLPNAKLNSTDTASYDLVVTLDAGKTADNVSISSMDQSDCVYFAQADDQAEQMAEEYAQDSTAYLGAAAAKDDDYFLSQMTRKITLTLEKKSATSDRVNVAISYEYTGDSRYVQRSTLSESDNAVKDNGVSAVYVYYYPLYGTSTRDVFAVSNTSNLDVDVYFIAVRGDDYSKWNWDNYHPSISVTEGSTTSAVTGLYSNLTTWQGSAASRVESLGKRETAVYQYNITMQIYDHDESAFELNEDGKMTYTPASGKLITTFTGSVLNEEE